MMLIDYLQKITNCHSLCVSPMAVMKATNTKVGISLRINWEQMTLQLQGGIWWNAAKTF